MSFCRRLRDASQIWQHFVVLEFIRAQLYNKVRLGALAFNDNCMPTNSSYDMLFTFNPAIQTSECSNSSALSSNSLSYCRLMMMLSCCSIFLTLVCTLSLRLDPIQILSFSKSFPKKTNCTL